MLWFTNSKWGDKTIIKKTYHFSFGFQIKPGWYTRFLQFHNLMLKQRKFFLPKMQFLLSLAEVESLFTDYNHFNYIYVSPMPMDYFNKISMYLILLTFLKNFWHFSLPVQYLQFTITLTPFFCSKPKLICSLLKPPNSIYCF